MSKTTWTIKGKLLGHTRFDEINTAFANGDGDVPLAGVLVRVSGKESKLDPTGFEEWGSAYTASDGSFQISKVKDHNKRYFRIEIKFDNSTLKIFPEHKGLLDTIAQTVGPTTDIGKALRALDSYIFETEWITVWQDDQEKKGPGVVDFRHLTFSGTGAEGLDGVNERCQADIWFLACKVIDKLKNLGKSDLGYTKFPLQLKYPHHNPLIAAKDETAYADPFTDAIYYVKNSVRDNFDLQTVMHEMMHVRNYHHSTGEQMLALELLLYGSTHEGRLAETYTGFHEAAAEIWKTELYREMFGPGATLYTGGEKLERAPFTRKYLKKNNICSLDDIEHYEHGWISVLNLLLCRKVDTLDMNSDEEFAQEKTGGGPPTIARKTTSFSLADLLTAFDPLLPKFPKQIDISEMTLDGFFQRLAVVNPDFDTVMQKAYKKILDPDETGQPSDLLPAIRVMPAGMRS